MSKTCDYLFSKSGRSLQSDFLWKNLIKELQLYDVGQPYWFCNDSVALIFQWLDEVLSQQSKPIQVEFYLIR